jgi:hypothetical protein
MSSIIKHSFHTPRSPEQDVAIRRAAVSFILKIGEVMRWSDREGLREWIALVDALNEEPKVTPPASKPQAFSQWREGSESPAPALPDAKQWSRLCSRIDALLEVALPAISGAPHRSEIEVLGAVIEDLQELRAQLRQGHVWIYK